MKTTIAILTVVAVCMAWLVSYGTADHSMRAVLWGFDLAVWTMLVGTARQMS